MYPYRFALFAVRDRALPVRFLRALILVPQPNRCARGAGGFVFSDFARPLSFDIPVGYAMPLKQLDQLCCFNTLTAPYGPHTVRYHT